MAPGQTHTDTHIVRADLGPQSMRPRRRLVEIAWCAPTLPRLTCVACSFVCLRPKSWQPLLCALQILLSGSYFVTDKLLGSIAPKTEGDSRARKQERNLWAELVVCPDNWCLVYATAAAADAR